MLKHTKWRKGAGTFIGYTIAAIGLTYFLILIIGFSILNNAYEGMEDAAFLIGRDVVTCESLEEAQEKAQDEAKTLLGHYGCLKKDSIIAYVEYAPGSEEKWMKGNFIKIYLEAKVKTNEPITSGTKSCSSMFMIERNSNDL